MLSCATQVPQTTAVDPRDCRLWRGGFGWVAPMALGRRGSRRSAEHPANALHSNPAVRALRPLARNARDDVGARDLGATRRANAEPISTKQAAKTAVVLRALVDLGHETAAWLAPYSNGH